MPIYNHRTTGGSGAGQLRNLQPSKSDPRADDNYRNANAQANNVGSAQSAANEAKAAAYRKANWGGQKY
jgi:hypothetical protein